MLFGTKPTWLVVGLGNPGGKYQGTRHNVGFCVLELLAKDAGVKVDRLKFRALTATAKLGGQNVLLMKPQTYMNLSGEAVQAAASFYKIPPERVLILFDDVSLAPGRIRVRPTGSAGGHNGIKSIIAQLGSQDFPRVKVGVGEKPHPDYDMADWVLSTFSAADQKVMQQAYRSAADAAVTILESGCETAMAKFNGLK